MTFKRGAWRCASPGCGDDAVLSFVVVISDSGTRKDRRQACAQSVRLCLACARQFARGVMVPPFQVHIDAAIKKLTGGK